MIQSSGGQFFVGIVEDRNDPLMLGRARVRVVGLHTHDKTILPTDDLPWAMLMQPATGTPGSSVIPPTEGTTVIVIFNDWPENQQPIIIGAIGGVPQGNPVHVDEFEDPPLFRDNITPAGRALPTSTSAANGNHLGPVTPQDNTRTTTGTTPTRTTTKTTGPFGNPFLARITGQAPNDSGKTTYGAFRNILGGSAQSAQGVGSLLNAVGGVGSTYGIAKSSFETQLLGTGNINSAIGRFKILATQSGPLGNAITSVLNGNASLKNLGRDLGLSTNQIKTTYNALKNPTNLLGTIANAEQLAFQVGSLAQNTEDVVGAVYSQVSQVTVEGTIGAVAGNVGNFLGAITGELGGIGSAGLNQIQRIANVFGIGNVTSGAQGLISSVVKSAFEAPQAVGATISSSLPFSSQKAADVNAGNITVLKTKESNEVTQKDFQNVAEGSTPPVSGAYGGPNYGGASPVLEMPKQDMTRYEGGAKGQIPTTPPQLAPRGSGSTAPPAEFSANRAKVEEGIKQLLAAADKYGLSTAEQKCALLGIVGGECGWVPVEESAQYSNPDRLIQIFQSTFKGNRQLAEQYSNWEKGKKGSKADFFNFVYDPANNGRQLGNSQPGDGGKYYGRGFIQLTGRSNYERYAQLSGHDIVKNPGLLVSDPSISAQIAVLYLMDRVKNAVPTAHPGYFYAAKQCVGNNSPDIAARKLSYYEHFYGLKSPESFGYAEKNAGNAQAPNSYQGAVRDNPEGLPDNRGFKDPHSKYPLKRYENEPEINRLARGQVGETVVALKQSKRTTGVPIALNGGSFSQPSIPFGASYPYNKVTETESGHVQEFDDTPGYERIHTYHKSGTFEEVDVNGTKVTRIIGDGYYILDRNGFISISGDCNLTVSGNVNIFCRSDANIEVAGSAEMKVGGNFDIGVARDMNVAVQGNLSMWANGSMNLQARKAVHVMSSEDSVYMTGEKEVHIQATADMFIESKQNQHLTAGESYYASAAEKVNIQSGEDMRLSGQGINAVSSDDLFITSSGSSHIKAGGNVEVDGSITNINSGTAADGTEAESSTPSTRALVHGMVPPALGTPIYPSYEPLVSPPMLGEEKYMYELPEDGKTNISVQYNAERTAQQGKENTYESESVQPTGGSGSINPSERQQQILAMTNFTADFRLSQHFTLGMMFDGGFNARHKLINQGGLTTQQIVANLATLSENVLEKYLAILPDGIAGYGKKWRITSGYRMGNNHSDHGLGRACDIAIFGGSKQAHFELIQKFEKTVPYDQMILEYDGPSVWIHTGIRQNTFGAGNANRKMAWTMSGHKNYPDPGKSASAQPGFKLLA